jgi:hypothetical protein
MSKTMSGKSTMSVTSSHMQVHQYSPDNYAIGYFKKQGFTTDISLEKSLWMGYIKDYEGGTIMQCQMVDKVKYQNVSFLISQHRKVTILINSGRFRDDKTICAIFTSSASRNQKH